MNNSIYCEFACNKGVIYEVVDGITMNDEYSETLDSMSIVLDNVDSSKRLDDIEPYTYVRVYGTGDFSFSKIMLVDNYVETRKNIIDKIYSYTISLMSELKLLEKCQCPNLSITHSLTGEKKTIYHYISRYMNLYAPKAKRNFAGYSPYLVRSIFSISERVETKFNVPCADMSMSCPTLRQVITNLMLQLGCIPTIKNGVLDYLDLKAENPTVFEVDDTITRITKSMSSDSYVNSLSYIGDQVLDSGNEVISEYLGFRDRDNALIKSTENLFLNTSFPIYKVDSFKILLKGDTVRFVAKNTKDSWNAYVSKVTNTTDGTHDTWAITIKGGTSDCDLRNFKIHLVKGTSYLEKVLDEFETYYVNNWTLGHSEGINNISAGGEKTIYVINEDYSRTGGTSGNPSYAIWIEFESTRTGYSSEYTIYPPQFRNVADSDAYDDLNLSYISSNARAISKFDITPLCVENAKRQQLEVDFANMGKVTTIDALSKYYYGTVGYSIGSKQISGFSQTYSKSVGWWTSTKTYLENILDTIKRVMENAESSKEYRTALVDTSETNSFSGYPMEYVAIPSAGLDDDTFGSLCFELKYQPLNEFNMTFAKDSDNPLRIAQYDSGNGGVQDFDRLAANENDKVNRLGNDVLVIMQTTDDASKVVDILSNGVVSYSEYSLRQKKTYQIFKRTLSIRKHRISATYYASKGYVMQNYFTAITTKYRAYENVDYEASTKRRENISSYLLITEGQHDLLTPESTDSEPFYITNKEISSFASGLVNQDDSRKIKYAVSYDRITKTKAITINEVSSITSKNTIAFSLNQFDNVMAGIKLKTSEVNNDLGGIEQEWIPTSEEFQEWNNTYLASFIPFNEDLEHAVDDMINAPDITRIEIDAETDCVYEILLNNFFDKDQGETLSITFQVELYTDSDNIEWTDALLENCKFIARNDYHPNMVFINRTDDLSSEERSITLATSKLTGLSPSDVITFGNDYFTIDWTKIPSATSLRISHWTETGISTGTRTGKVIDYAEIKRYPSDASTQTFYTYLNDCKSLKIMDRDSNGLLYVSSTI